MDKKYLFIQAPILKKGRKIVSLILSDNKGGIVYTDWKNTCDDKKLEKNIRELEKLNKIIDKKI